MKVVCIRQDVPGLSIGSTYYVLGGNADNMTVDVKNNYSSIADYKLGVDVIVLNEGAKGTYDYGKVEMYLSFLQAIEECGGNVVSISQNFDKNIRELCDALGPNGVRFKHFK